MDAKTEQDLAYKKAEEILKQEDLLVGEVHLRRKKQADDVFNAIVTPLQRHCNAIVMPL